MTKIFKPKRSIKKATKFKVQYMTFLEGKQIHEREFANIKSMSQWIYRNEDIFEILILKTLAFSIDAWEPFTTIGKKTITLADLKTIVKNLEEDFKPSIFDK